MKHTQKEGGNEQSNFFEQSMQILKVFAQTFFYVPFIV